METIAELIRRHARPGRVQWIGLRPARREEVLSVEEAVVDDAGLVGDRGGQGPRAVTLIQWEHLAVIGALLDAPPTDPALLRRNIAVSGINLLGLKGRAVRVGEALLRVTGPCAPCSRMEEVLGEGGYAAVRGHGGVTAEVVTGGRFRLGDAVTPAEDASVR
ncbi:MAG: MOSC domain-containing protein [Planctomycetota bacterium]|nr:MOSC domain-containing protein [Planctomycetota bacterium]